MLRRFLYDRQMFSVIRRMCYVNAVVKFEFIVIFCLLLIIDVKIETLKWRKTEYINYKEHPDNKLDLPNFQSMVVWFVQYDILGDKIINN